MKNLYIRRSIFSTVAFLLLTGITGCEKDKEESGIRVMTWNVYLGADINTFLLDTTITLLPAGLDEKWAAIQNSNFTERAEAIAVEIAGEQPHLVGLQEISSVKLQSPGDYLVGDFEEATDEVLNFLHILREELQKQGASYRVVAISNGFDFELPMLVNPDSLFFEDIRFQDHEVLLVREGVQAGNPTMSAYGTNLEISIGDSTITIVRGWVSIDVMIDGREFLFVTTHLESNENSSNVQEAQAAELIESLRKVQKPIILVGDFNSDADGSTTTTYGNLIAAGFVDAWTELPGSGTSYTCCQLADLTNSNSTLDRRTDYVLFSSGEGFDVRSIKRVGADTENRTLTGLWPSNHAGLIARIHLP